MNMTFSYYLEPLFVGDGIHAPSLETVQMYVYVNVQSCVTIEKINGPNNIKLPEIEKTFRITFGRNIFNYLYVIIKAYQ